LFSGVSDGPTPEENMYREIDKEIAAYRAKAKRDIYVDLVIGFITYAVITTSVTMIYVQLKGW
jgi:hypothetical protein